MENEIKIRKPEINDSGDIREILSQWTEPEEVVAAHGSPAQSEQALEV